MTPFTVGLIALAVILARIAWVTVRTDYRVRARARRRAQRALEAKRNG
jgi:hypothetical protein